MHEEKAQDSQQEPQARTRGSRHHNQISRSRSQDDATARSVRVSAIRSGEEQ